MNVDKIHIRHVILFVFNSGKNTLEAKEMISQAYGDNIVSLSTIKNWYARFRKGDLSLEDKQRSGRPKETLDEELQALLEEDNTQTTRYLAKQLNINSSTVDRRLRSMGKILKATRWVPYALSEQNKEYRMKISLSLLARHRRKSFLWRIVTGDEKWVYYDNPKRIHPLKAQHSRQENSGLHLVGHQGTVLL